MFFLIFLFFFILTSATTAAYFLSPTIKEKIDKLIKKEKPPVIDCVVSEWKSEACPTECGLPPSTVTSSRTILTNPLNGGKECPSLTDSVICPSTEACPVDCVVTDWIPEGTCTKPCGSGLQKYNRNITTPASGAGTQCPTDLTKTEACNDQACPSIETTVSSTSQPSVPSTETTTNQPSIVPAVDCVMSLWKTEGTCSKTCGGGLQNYNRSVVTPASGTGIQCPTNLTKTEACNVEPCPEPVSLQNCRPDMYTNCPDYANITWCTTYKGDQANKQCPSTCLAVTNDPSYCTLSSTPSAPAPAPVCRPDLYPNDCYKWATAAWCNQYEKGPDINTEGEAHRQCSATCLAATGDNKFC